MTVKYRATRAVIENQPAVDCNRLTSEHADNWYSFWKSQLNLVKLFVLCSQYYSDIHFILISWYAWIKCNQCAIPYYYRDIIVIKSYKPTNIVIQIFLYRSNTSGWDLFQQSPVQKLWGYRFQRTTLMCDCALSLPLVAQFWQLLNMGHSSIYGIGATVSWLQVLKLSLSLRLAVTLYYHQFAVLHSGAFVWSTSQHQKDWATLGFPWLVFRGCVWGCPLCLCSADMEMVNMELEHVWITNVWGYAEALDRVSSTQAQ